MNNVEKFFNKLNNEMAYLDPYKWLLDVEPEHIPEMIGELKEDIWNLENQDYDGDLKNLKHWNEMNQKTIKYKKECIEILINIKGDYDIENI